MQMYIDSNELKQEYDQSPEWMQKLMNAFADGVNYYMYTHPEVEPLLLTRFEPWMALSFTEGSIGGDIERISVRGLADFYGNGEMGLIDEVIPEEEREPTGSNGISIAPKLSSTGNALFLINPHTSFFFRCEVHLVSEEGLNAYGAVTWGQFFVYQGFNDKCGWMHTSSRADAIDYFAETIRNYDGQYQYFHDGSWKPVKVRSIPIRYKTDSGFATRLIDTYYTHHGPVIRHEDGKWITISLMKEHIKALTQSYMRTKARSYDEFKSTMDLNTNSSNNTVYADADGNIAYFHGNFIPVRDESFDWSEIVDGSNPDADWKGLHTIEEMVHILNPETGWIQNCNSTPFTASGPDSPKQDDYPKYMAPDIENYRGIHAVKVLEGKNEWTIDKLRDAAYDPYLPGFAIQIPPLLESHKRIMKEDPELAKYVSSAIEILSKWDYRHSRESISTTIANYWGRSLMRIIRNEAGEKQINIYTYMEEYAADIDRISALKEAIDILDNDFGTWEVPWGDVNRYQRISSDIVQPFNDDLPSLPVEFVSGRWGALASYGSRQYEDTRKWYGTSGNSFVALVEFGDSIIAKSILTGGQSSDVNSPHFDDQALMYTNGEFKDVAFYTEDVEKRAEETYHPGKREK